jgi:hypothetical protein
MVVEKSLEVATSKPAGGAMLIPAFILVPATVKLVGNAEALP